MTKKAHDNVISIGKKRPKKARTTEPPPPVEGEEVVQAEHESPEAFARRFFGEPGNPIVPQDGMPSLEWLKETYKTKSAAIRYLHHKGFSPNQIHKHLGIRYQHARNVCKTELKRGPNEDWRPPEMRALPEPPVKEVT